MNHVHKIEAMQLNFIYRAFLVPGVALERIIGYFLRRVDITFKSFLNILILIRKIQCSLQLSHRKVWHIQEIGEIIEEFPEIKQVLEL